jgi:hypothetical protein
MTDKELLEKAAKAAGIDLRFLSGNIPFSDGPIRIGEWNPLTDDGDALRLAVKLGMLFTYMKERFDIFQKFYLEELDNDLKPSEATRRAIVRAAAIGEKL